MTKSRKKTPFIIFQSTCGDAVNSRSGILRSPLFFHSFLNRRGWGWKTHWVCFFFAWPQRAADTGPGRLGGAAFRRVRAPVGCDGRRLQTGGAKTRAKQTPSRTTKPRVFSPWPEKELSAHFSLCLLSFFTTILCRVLVGSKRGPETHTAGSRQDPGGAPSVDPGVRV